MRTIYAENGLPIGGKELTAVRSVDWLIDIELSSRIAVKLFGDSAEDTRLNDILKSAVAKEFAPQSLIDAITYGIRNAE